METENASAEISCQSVSGGGSWQMLATVSTASPVSQADVGLLFWRFSGAGGFSYRQLEAPCYQVCFSALGLNFSGSGSYTYGLAITTNFFFIIFWNHFLLHGMHVTYVTVTEVANTELSLS